MVRDCYVSCKQIENRHRRRRDARVCVEVRKKNHGSVREKQERIEREQIGERGIEIRKGQGTWIHM